jgi:hypothetical protein
MQQGDTWRHGEASADYWIPGLIEGRMTVHCAPGGSVSFRVVIDVSNGSAAERDQFELVISADQLPDLGRALADHARPGADATGPVQAFPCHIGFRRQATETAA